VVARVTDDAKVFDWRGVEEMAGRLIATNTNRGNRPASDARKNIFAARLILRPVRACRVERQTASLEAEDKAAPFNG
jgi:hypothetical protein